MGYRTDLALERGSMKGKTTVHRGLRISRTQERDTQYITVEAPQITGTVTGDASLRLVLTKELQALLPQDGCVLVAGLGNPAITPDALGPLCADRVLATRHVRGAAARAVGLSGLRSVAVVKPGVLGTTGVETAEFLLAVVKALRPCAVVAVDALAAGKLHRLGKTVQLSDGGIAPGAGVGNPPPQLDPAPHGVPGLGLGGPTGVAAPTLCGAVCTCDTARAPADTAGMMVTPRGIDALVSRAAHVLALSLNCALNPRFEPRVFEELL